MRYIFTLILLASALIATTNSGRAATPVDALLTRFETENPDCSLVALYDGDRIVLLQLPVAMVEVKASAGAKRSAMTATTKSSAAACFVGLLARAATV